ncbi:MAG: hypothetical protein JNL79_12045 [Myxococcales bacterium]|nr:hypothetical protein [Myxococcales bacterium]
MGLFGRMATALGERRIKTALSTLDAQLASLGRSIVDDVRRRRASVQALEAAEAVEARWRQREARARALGAQDLADEAAAAALTAEARRRRLERVRDEVHTRAVGARSEFERLRGLRERLSRSLPPAPTAPPSALDRELEARKEVVREEAREARFRVFDEG